jgi:hypothetical protein
MTVLAWRWAVLMLLGTVSIAQTQTIYHVSLDGNDNDNGNSATSAWRSLAKANATVAAGDVVVIHGGEYTDGIHPVNSGRSGSPITFQAVEGDRVILHTATGVQLGANHSYIVVEGLEVYATYRVAELNGSSNITIRNCAMFGGRGNYGAFGLENASYCVIRNNYLDRQDPDAESGGGDGLALTGQSNHNLIEGNTVTRCGHVAFASAYRGQYQNIWRNNLAYENHTNYSLQDGVERSVFENNTGYYQGLVWTGGDGNGLQFTGTNCIIRYNTLYGDTSTAYTGRHWMSIVGAGTGSDYGSPSMERNKIYNNTIYGENDQTQWDKSGWRNDNYNVNATQADNVFKNNIFAAAPGVQIDDIDTTRSLEQMSNRYVANLLFGAHGQPAFVRYEYGGGGVVWTLDDAKRTKPASWAATNLEADPFFVNTVGQGPAKDFNLRPGSPAIDAGVDLAVATAGGSGTTLVVDDANYFTDGWGIPGVVGDSIKIDQEAPVGIAQVDYATNTITLNAPRSWVQGSSIYYFRSDRFQGAAPDRGSHELGGQTPPPPPSRPPTPVLFSPRNGADNVDSNVTLRWSDAGSLITYEIQVSKDANFSSRDFDVTTRDAFLNLPSLSSATTYFWRVNARNAAGTSDWSQVWSLTTVNPSTPQTNILSNPTFDEGLTSWWGYSNGQAEFSVSSSGYAGANAGKLRITSTGDNTQIFQYDIVLEPNKKYTLSFAAYSTSGHDVDVSLAQHSTPYTNYGLYAARFDLGTGWKVFTLEFTTGNFTSTVRDARLQFWFAPYAAAGDEYFIDNVVLAPSSQALSAPTLIAPPHLATDQATDITLRWQQKSKASAYAVEVASDNSFGVKIAADTAVVDTQYRLSSLQHSTAYYWRVSAQTEAGWTPFSSVYSFTTSALPLSSPIFTNLPIENGIAPLEFTVGWSRIPGATGYQLQIASDSLYQSLEVNDSTITDTVRTVGPLRHATTYFMRVRAIAPGEARGPFGSSVQFMATSSELAVPQLLSLPGLPDQQPVSLTAVWVPSPGATHYRLQLGTDPSFNVLLVDDSTVTDTVRRLGPLQDALTYYMRVRAENSLGRSLFSNTLVFTTSAGQLSVPFVVVLPGQNANRPLVTLIRWFSVQGAARYHLQLATDLQFRFLVVNDSTLADTVAQIGPLAYGTTYFARVRALNDRTSGAFSLPYGFSTVQAAPGAPGSIVLSSQVQQTAVTLSWPTTPGALSYHLQVSKDSLFTAFLVDDSSLTDTVRKVSSLAPSTRYFARVRAKGTGGVGPYGATFVFTTAATPPTPYAPPDYLLEQNFPNPFNPSTKIRYGVPTNVHVRIILFNALGQQVQTLVDSDQAAGRYEIEFTKGQLASGTYFYMFQAGDFVQTMKLLLVK